MSTAQTSLIACFIVLPVLAPKSAGGTQSPLIPTEVRAARAAYDRAFNLRKPAALDAILDRDFEFVTPGGGSKGLAEAKASSHGLAASRPDVVFVHEPKEVQAYEPWGIAAESGTWYEKWSEPDGPTRLNGRYLAMWVLDRHHWRLNNELIVPIRCRGSNYCSK